MQPPAALDPPEHQIQFLVFVAVCIRSTLVKAVVRVSGLASVRADLQCFFSTVEYSQMHDDPHLQVDKCSKVDKHSKVEKDSKVDKC